MGVRQSGSVQHPGRQYVAGRGFLHEHRPVTRRHTPSGSSPARGRRHHGGFCRWQLLQESRVPELRRTRHLQHAGSGGDMEGRFRSERSMGRWRNRLLDRGWTDHQFQSTSRRVEHHLRSRSVHTQHRAGRPIREHGRYEPGRTSRDGCGGPHAGGRQAVRRAIPLTRGSARDHDLDLGQHL